MYKDLKHLNSTEINKIIYDYYEGVKSTKDIINECSLSIPVSRLYTLFPPLEHKNYTCEYCDTVLVTDRKSKSNNQYSEWDLYCPTCQHRPYIENCKCDNCCEKAQILIFLKEEKIKEVYSSQMDTVKFSELDFINKVYLGALCEYSVKENLYEFIPYQDIKKYFNLTPTRDTLKILYESLIYSRIIKVSPLSELSAFVDNDSFPANYYLEKVMYDLNLELSFNKKELFDNILNPKYYLSNVKDVALLLWKQIAVGECIEYLVNQLNKVNFKFEAGEKTYKTFEILLDDFSVAQIFAIIWKSVAEASRLYLETGMTKKHAANSTISACQRYAEKALANGWKLTEYSRPRDLPQSELSRFFFNKVIKIYDLGFIMPPSAL